MSDELADELRTVNTMVTGRVEKRPDGYYVLVKWWTRAGEGVMRRSESKEFGPFAEDRADRLVTKFREGFFNILL